MILTTAAKHKFKEHLLVAASVKCFLISMTKVFLFSKLLYQNSLTTVAKSLATVSSLNNFQQNIYLVISCFTDILLI